MLMRHDSAPPAQDAEAAQTPEAAALAAAARHQEYSRAYMSKLYSNAPEFESLELAATSCTDAAVTALADALRVNATVTHLDLRRNGITDVGARHVAEALLTNQALRTLRLDGNDIGAAGIERLAVAMESNLTLRALTLEDCAPPADAGMTGARKGTLVAATVVSDSLPLMDAAEDAAERRVSLPFVPDPSAGRYTADGAETGPPADTAAARAKARARLALMIELNAHPLALKQLVLGLRAGSAPEVVSLALERHMHPRLDPAVHIDDYCAGVLADVLDESAPVTRLDLTNQRVTDIGAKALAAMLDRNHHLDKIILNGNQITDIGADAFIDALQRNNSLRQVQLFDNVVTDDAIVRLEFAAAQNRQPLRLKHHLPLLRANAPELVELELCDAKAQRFYDDVAVRLLADALQSNSVLHTLTMAFNKITPVGARIMADIFRRTITLRTVDLSHNPIGEGGCEIARALCVNTSVEWLNLSGCSLTDEVVSEIAAALEINATLKHLDISANPEIGARGDDLAFALSVNRALLSIELDGTSLTTRVRQAIADRLSIAHEPAALQKVLPLLHSDSEALTEVVLRDCKLTDSSMRLLAPAIRDNYVVSKLDVSHNRISFDGMSELFVALQENRITLTHVDMSHNPIGQGERLGRLVAGLVTTHAKLVWLGLANVGLNTEGLECIFNEVDTPKLNTIRHIDVSANEMCDKTLVALFGLLLRCNSLAMQNFKSRLRALIAVFRKERRRAVDMPVLEFNGFLQYEDRERSDDEVDACVSVLCGFIRAGSFTTVQYCNNRMTSTGCKQLAECVAERGTVRALQLIDNRIGDEGALALAGAAKRNYCLSMVDVTGNPDISEASLDELRAMLLYNQQPEAVKKMLVAVGDGQVADLDVSDRTTQQMNDSHIRMLCGVIPGSRLRSINLSNNYVSEKGLALLCRTLRGNRTVARLEVRNALVTGGEELGCEVAALITSNTPLARVDLSHNEISDAFVPPLLEALEANTSMSYFGLAGCGLSPELEAAVSTKASLNDASTLKSVVAQVKDNDAEVTDFNVAGGGYTDLNVMEMFSALTDNTTVSKVDVSGNNLTDTSGGVMLRHLAANSTVTALNLANNGFGPALVESLRNVLLENKGLVTIDLRSNAFSPGDLLRLAPAAEVNEVCIEILADATADEERRALDRFTLNRQRTLKQAIHRMERGAPVAEVTCSAATGDCVTDFGLLCLEECLAASESCCDALDTIVATDGELTDAGAKVLMRILMRSRSLSTVDVRRNAIGNQGAVDLAGALTVNAALQRLLLAGNPIGSRGASALRRALHLNETLVECVLVEPTTEIDIAAAAGDTAALLAKAAADDRPLLAVERADEEMPLAEHMGQLEKLVFLNTRTPLLKQFCTDSAAQVLAVLDLSGLAEQTLFDMAAARRRAEAAGIDLALSGTGFAAGDWRASACDGQRGGSQADGDLLRRAARDLMSSATSAGGTATPPVGVGQSPTIGPLSGRGSARPASRPALQQRPAPMAWAHRRNAPPAFDDAACVELCRELRRAPHVTHLNLSHNRLAAPRVGNALADMLLENKTLRIVDLSFNSLASNLSAVADSLAENSSVISLDARSNGASEHLMRRLELFQALNLEPPRLKEEIVGIVHRHREPRCIEVVHPQLDNGALSTLGAAAAPQRSAYGSMALARRDGTTPPGVRGSMAAGAGMAALRSIANAAADTLATAFSFRDVLAADDGPEAMEAYIAHGPSKRDRIRLAGVGIGPKVQLDDRSVTLLCGALKANLSVRILDLRWNGITDLGARALAAMAKANPGVSKLLLAHNNLTDGSAEALVDLMAGSPSIQVIDVSHMLVGVHLPVSKIVTALAGNPRALKFDISGCRFSAADVERADVFGMVNAVLQGEPREQLLGAMLGKLAATTVDLSGLASRNQWLPEIPDLLVQAAPIACHTETLLLEFNDLGDSVVPRLAAALERWPALKHLSLACNQITDPSPVCQLLQNVVSGSPTASEAGLRSPRGASPLAMRVQSRARLVEAPSMGAPLGDTASLPTTPSMGATAMAAARRPKSRLESLSLRRNQLGPSAAIAIAHMIRENDSLTHLDVSDCGIGRVGATFILSALPMNETLRSVELAGEGISQELLQKKDNALTLHYRNIPVPGRAQSPAGGLR